MCVFVSFGFVLETESWAAVRDNLELTVEARLASDLWQSFLLSCTMPRFVVQLFQLSMWWYQKGSHDSKLLGSLLKESQHCPEVCWGLTLCGDNYCFNNDPLASVNSRTTDYTTWVLTSFAFFPFLHCFGMVPRSKVTQLARKYHNLKKKSSLFI